MVEGLGHPAVPSTLGTESTHPHTMPVSEKVYDSFDGRAPREHREIGFDQVIVLDTRERHYVRRDDDGTAVAVTMIRSSYRTGWRRREARRWYRWSDDEFLVVRKVGRGRLMMLKRSGKGFQSKSLWGPIQPHTLSSLRDVLAGRTKFSDLVVAELGHPPSFREYYPLAEHYTELSPLYDPAFLRCFDGVTDVRELVVRLYGKRAYRASLVKAVAQAQMPRLYLSWCLRGRHIPVDWHVEYLRKAPRTGEEPVAQEPPLHGLRPHLRHLSRRTVRRVMKEHVTHWTNLWLDDLRQCRPCPEISEADSWRDLHDKVVRRDRQMTMIESLDNQARHEKAAQKRAELHEKRLADPAYVAMLTERERQRELAEIESQKAEHKALGGRVKLYEDARGALSGKTGQGLTIKVARTSRQLLEWGNDMDHCIANYYQSIRGCSGLLLGAYLGEELLANAEVRMTEGGELSLSQLLGKRNQMLPQDVRSDIVEHLEGAGVSTGKRWVG